ncbi:MAG: NADH-quinone oxidoreductase subunit M [Planctomycetota bacterium]|nr:NADH-quinone oxidoreductase subunit M [Planctomycetota bacterium]
MTFLIPLIIVLPLFVGLGIFLAGKKGNALVATAVGTAALVLLMSLLLVGQVYTAGVPEAASGATIQPRLAYAPDWLQVRLPVFVGGHQVRWQLEFGADGIGALLVLLTGIVGLVTMSLATIQIKERLPQYLALMLISQSMLLGVFLSMDLLSFYLFFEAVLLPLVLLISGWGNREEAISASRKFLLYTLVGSVPMVLGLIGLALLSATPERASSVSFETLSSLARETQLAAISSASSDSATAIGALASKEQWIVWLLLLGFGIKLAILPLHTWLPTTYSVAHPNTTALIASVVAKLGVFGIIRIVVPLTPIALSTYAQMLFGGLGALAIVYGALVALSQTDLRKVLAYSSLSHVGFITLGLMSMNTEGLTGAAIQMFNHGIITCGMFLMLAMVEQRRGRLSLAEQDRGLAAVYPRLGVMMVFFTLAGAGLPGLNGFVGEVLAMTGMLRVSGLFTGIAVLGTVLGAWYGLRIVQRLLFGSDGVSHSKVSVGGTGDIQVNEFLPLVGLAVVCLFLGLRPQDTIHLIEKDIARIANVSEPSAKAIHPEMDGLVAQIKP